jgi:hypothetical protein
MPQEEALMSIKRMQPTRAARSWDGRGWFRKLDCSLAGFQWAPRWRLMRGVM